MDEYGQGEAAVQGPLSTPCSCGSRLLRPSPSRGAGGPGRLGARVWRRGLLLLPLLVWRQRLLERPFDEVLESGQPDFPFCLCWANQTWTGIWHGTPNRVLIEQTYPGEDDHRRHFEYLLRAFADKRYLRIDGMPVFIVYNPDELPDSLRVTELWRELATRAGLPGLFLMAEHSSPDWNPKAAGFDARIGVASRRAAVLCGSTNVETSGAETALLVRRLAQSANDSPVQVCCKTSRRETGPGVLKAIRA